MPWKGLSDLRESVDYWPRYRVLFILTGALIGFPASLSCGGRCWFVPKVWMGIVGIWKAVLGPSWFNLCPLVAVLVQGLCEDRSSKGRPIHSHISRLCMSVFGFISFRTWWTSHLLRDTHPRSNTEPKSTTIFTHGYQSYLLDLQRTILFSFSIGQSFWFFSKSVSKPVTSILQKIIG